MEEIYKEISYCKGYYISNLGNVKHNDEVILKSSDYYNEYLRILLPLKDQYPFKWVHRLVAEAFIENPENKGYVNHKDFNKSNNSVENLEWVTASENSKHMTRAGRRRGGWASFTKEQRMGKNNPMFGKRFKCMNNLKINKYVPLDEVDNYLKLGWVLGRNNSLKRS